MEGITFETIVTFITDSIVAGFVSWIEGIVYSAADTLLDMLLGLHAFV
ncbi:MAG: hypothetical protein HYV26_06790 [Candidatus Hydrogenedentes bacterium]|nr:hypothetical protein [Candidatus Hydrogenedentota bacterium]